MPKVAVPPQIRKYWLSARGPAPKFLQPQPGSGAALQVDEPSSGVWGRQPPSSLFGRVAAPPKRRLRRMKQGVCWRSAPVFSRASVPQKKAAKRKRDNPGVPATLTGVWGGAPASDKGRVGGIKNDKVGPFRTSSVGNYGYLIQKSSGVSPTASKSKA